MGKTFIIAEAGVNHNGDIEIAKRLCLAAKQSGADAVKFQTWKTEDIITEDVRQADYQIKNTGAEDSQYQMLKKLELSYEQFSEIKRFCDDIGILFLSTPDERDSLDFLVSLGVPCIKIGSGDIDNISFLRYAGSKRLPVILSTGMSTLGDIEISVRALQDGGCNDIALLHCTTNYPCPYPDVNLNAMNTLHAAFGLPIGYSDHTVGTDVAIAAVAKGAQIIEKHFTLDKNMPGPDHPASTEPSEFAAMVKSIRNVENALGSGLKIPTESEKEIAVVVKKRIVAKRTIGKGQTICEDDICVKRSNCGVPASLWDKVIGSVAMYNYQVDDGIKLELL